MRAFVLTLNLILATAALSAAGQQQPPNKSVREEVSTVSGVVIQQGVDFAIANPENMKPIAVLQSVDFNNGNFANYIGQQVKVRGTLASTADGRTILLVRRLSDIERAPTEGASRR